MGTVREVYNKLVRITCCKTCGRKMNNRVTTCESGHMVCDDCYSTQYVCDKCGSNFFDRYHIFYNKVMAALSDEINYLERLFDILECPVCYDNLTCPSWTCWNGHVTCGRCYFYTPSCPLCREEFTTYYSADINKLLRVLERPIDCMNRSHGCGYSNKYPAIKKHQSECKFRQYRCFINSCDFTGFLSQLCRHVLQSHPKLISKLDRSRSIDFRATSEKNICLITSESEAYWLITMLERKQVKISVIYIGYKPNVTAGSLEIQNERFTIPVVPITDMEEPDSVYTLNLGSDFRIIGKNVWCNLTLNSNKTGSNHSFIVNTLFGAILIANLVCCITLFKHC